MERILKCKIKKSFDVRTYGNDFKVQTIIVDAEDSKYETDIPVDFKQDSIDLLSTLKVGDVVNIFYNLQGKHWKDDKYFMNLSAWKVEVLESSPEVEVVETQEEVNDDLPF